MDKEENKVSIIGYTICFLLVLLAVILHFTIKYKYAPIISVIGGCIGVFSSFYGVYKYGLDTSLNNKDRLLLFFMIAILLTLFSYRYGFSEGYKAREVDQIKETIDQILSKACADPENQHQLYCHSKNP